MQLFNRSLIRKQAPPAVDGAGSSMIRAAHWQTKLARLLLLCLASLLLPWFAQPARADQHPMPPKTYYRTALVNGHSIFYREAGDPKKTTILLLHGFPSSSHTYRELIPLLSSHYHIIAPDYLGSGYSEHPDPDQFRYTFDTLADHVAGLMQVLKITRFTIYMQDFGAPVGFRIVARHPDRISSLIIQNANAYLDGLTPARQAFFRKAHEDRSPEHVAFLYSLVSREGIIDRQYLRDIPTERRDIISPDSWTHDLVFLQSKNDKQIQVQLFQDYQANIDAYPVWQATLRKHQYPTLIAWGKRDPAFIAAGAEAYRRDLPNADLHLLDAGHFAVEEKATEIAQLILAFMARH
jgi:pimeloyl-ACP methyl ester carboxylesterase